ncbi:MAG TPA: glycosyltransferase family 2 protein [Blastocatellia bacterium]|nr:glycosyltransferase family 2 protein [Blastocatellia bacterium]
MKITAIIITLNEEANIQRALESLGWADEIIVVDSGSTDRTVEIARQFTGKVIVKDWPGYSAQKNFAAEQASNDWIFSLDADEELSTQLISEIATLKGSADAGLASGMASSSAQALNVAGYEMPRLCRYMGRWIRHSGWYPDYKLRLYRRNAGCWKGDFVHESVKVQGGVRRLKGDLLHYTVRSASEHHQRMDRYTTLAAEEMYKNGKRASAGVLMISPIANFIRSYVFRLGVLDGAPGLAIAYFAAHYAFLKYVKLWELEKRGRSKE